MSALLRKINIYILNPLILFCFGVALVYFLWGIFKFLSNPDSEEEREKGKRSIFWGIIGMVIMISVYGIIGIILGTFGIPAPNTLSNKL